VDNQLQAGRGLVGLSEDRLREVMDTLPAYVAYVDKDLRYVMANRMYMERFGLPEHGVVGQLVADVTGPAFEAVAPHLQAALRGETQRLEPKMISVDGPRHLVVMHLPHYVPKNSNGVREIDGVIVYGYDVTEQRRAEGALLQSEKLAAVGRLAASVAHEINNPLESVTNLLYLMEREQDLAHVQMYVRLAQQELSRVGQIATQTLQFFRQSTVRTTCDLSSTVESVLALYAGRLRNSAIVVQRELEYGVAVRCFDGEIRQVLNNLIGNAMDAMRKGGVLRVRVRWGTDAQGTRGARVTVADTGSGINPAVLARVFEPFFTTKGDLGTGLGLWISTDLLGKHHSSLRVRSLEGKGTVFSFLLPVVASGE
jgi:PAS domain S-box-containing protein